MTIYSWCDQCGSPIHIGDRVWFKNSDLYCHSKCLIDSFSKSEDPEQSLLREKEIAKQQRVDMMQEIFSRRQKARLS